MGIIVRVIKLNYIFVIVLTAFTTLYSQNTDMHFEHITDEQGLSQNHVYCILQDSRGFMWFGTQDGLNRYDGYDFEVFRKDPNDSYSLSGNFVLAIIEDRWGVLWIGTLNDGLNRFDRNTGRFIRFQHDPADSNSLSGNRIWSIHEDHSGELWIGTTDGLNRYDRKTGHFIRYYHNPDDPNSLSNNAIFSIYTDRGGALWIGTRDGLNQFERGTGRFIRYKNDPANPNSLSGNGIYGIHEDRLGVLWLGTNNGLNGYDRETGCFVRYRHDPDDPKSLSSSRVWSIHEDRYGILWIGTRDGGLDRFDRETGRFFCYRHDPSDPSSLSSDNVFNVYEDRSGLIWLGTLGGGLNKYNRIKESFLHCRNNPADPNSLSHNNVYSIFQDKSGLVWIGTDGGGLNRFIPDEFGAPSAHVVHYRNEPDNPYSLSNDRISVIQEDSHGVLWIGTYGGGLNRYDRKTGRFIHYRHNPNDRNSLSTDYVYTICEDHTGILWIGTQEGGLNRYDREKDKFISYRHNSDDPFSLSSDDVKSIYEDRSGNLWIGTSGGGLNQYDKATDRFRCYQDDPGNPFSLSNNTVNDILENKLGELWVGTNSGLNKLDKSEDTFIHYSEKDGLPNDVIYGILEDDHGDLWLSTNKGLSKFDPQAETFRNYTVRDGLQGNAFNDWARYKSRSGMMYFGGTNGFNVFHPDSIRDNPYIPPVVITDFQLFNTSVPIGEIADGRTLLSTSITETDEIRLNYKDNVFSFIFAALHYAYPEGNEYAYMMDGFEDHWNYVGNKRDATYTNLSPGRYTFRVKASNSDGVWNEEGVSLAIYITPPFWQTWWFKTLLFFAAGGLVLCWHERRIRTIRKQKEVLDVQVEERTHELNQKKKELTQSNRQLKNEVAIRKKAEGELRILLNEKEALLKEKEVLLKEIHHRVKNNLAVISSLLNLQQKNIVDEKDLEMFRESQNRVRLMALIHEKLYKSKDMAKVDFDIYVRDLVNAVFRSYDVSPGKVKINITVKDVALGVDKAIPCGMIINELLSNSLKYAFPPSFKDVGSINISIHTMNETQVELVVSDNGVGIPNISDVLESDSLGMKLIFMLSEDQLNGKVRIEGENGFRYSLIFAVD